MKLPQGGPRGGIGHGGATGLLSYRRGDSAGHAGRLFDRLAAWFGRQRVFQDLEAIPPGADFAERIAAGVQRCDVLLVVIGPAWSSATDQAGQRRLDDPSDLVVFEVAAALHHEIPVIPVLVHQARMPSAEELPERIAALASRNAVEISDGRWDYDLEQLVAAIEQSVQTTTKAEKPDVRRTVTVVLADLVGSTALGERLDPEALRQVVTRFYDRAAAALTRHGGVRQKLLGDDVMAVFGVPSLHEDDALRAVRGAVDLRGEIAALNGELRRDWGTDRRRPPGEGLPPPAAARTGGRGRPAARPSRGRPPGSSGQRALDRDDARAAVKLLTRAAELLPDDDQERPALTAALGEALYLSAEYQQGAELLTAEIGRHQTTADHRAVMRLRAIRADVADEFWEAIGPAETGGYLYLVAGDPTKAQQILRRAYDALDQIGEKGVMSTQAALLAQAICLAGGPDEEAERFARIGRETAAIEDILSQVPSLGALAKVLARRGELGEAERLARDAVRLAEATDWLSLHGDALVDLATVLGQAGRFDDARPVIRAALGLYHRKGNRASAARARATLAARARGG